MGNVVAKAGGLARCGLGCSTCEGGGRRRRPLTTHSTRSILIDIVAVQDIVFKERVKL
jgi:hypothetical protein